MTTKRLAAIKRVFAGVLVCAFAMTLNFSTAYAAIGQGTVSGGIKGLNVRAGASTDTEIIAVLSPGSTITVEAEQNGWYQVTVDGKTGYVSAKYVTLGGGTSDTAAQQTVSNESTPLTPDGNLSLVDDYYYEYTSTEDGTTTSTTTGSTTTGSTTTGSTTESSLTSSGTSDTSGSTSTQTVTSSSGSTTTGQQFITLVTKAGNTFYLVIDREDNGSENVYFMNLVDEADLFALLEEDEQEEYTAAQEADVTTEDETDEAAEDEETEEQAEEEKSSGSSAKGIASLVLLVIIGLAGGGFYVYNMLQKKKKEKAALAPDPDAGYDDEDDPWLPISEDKDFQGNMQEDDIDVQTAEEELQVAENSQDFNDSEPDFEGDEDTYEDVEDDTPV